MKRTMRLRMVFSRMVAGDDDLVEAPGIEDNLTLLGGFDAPRPA